MDKIQDQYALEEKIYGLLEEYLQEADCNQDPMLAVWKRCGKLNVAVDERANLKLTKTADVFPLAEVLRPTEEDATMLEPDNDKMLAAKFNFWLTKGQGTEIVVKSQKKYLGMDAILALPDSTGANVYYFEVLKYDDECFRNAVAAADRAIAMYPERLMMKCLDRL